MEKDMDHGKIRARDITLTFVLLVALLFFTLPARAMDARVLICSPKEQICTVTSARIVFVVPCETPIPTACLSTGIAKAAEVSDLIAKDELVRFETVK